MIVNYVMVVSKLKLHAEVTEETLKSFYLKVEEITVKNTKWKKSAEDKSVESVKMDLGLKILMMDNSIVLKLALAKTNMLLMMVLVKNVLMDLSMILVTEK